MSQVSAGLPPSAKSGTYQLKKLRELHHNILRLSAAGMKQNRIAALLGVTPVMVNYTINCELGQQKLKVLRGEADGSTVDILKEMQNLSPVALAVLEEILMSPSAKDSDKKAAAELILSGAGYGKRQQVDLNVHHLTDDDITAARLAARDKTIELRLDEYIEEAEVIEVADKDG